MKLNARHTPNIAFFSDDFRDTIKGNNFENRSRGYVNGATGSEEYVKEVMCGRIPHPQIPNLTKFAWTLSPCQTVNYVEAHDNLTLWDKLIYTNPTDELLARIRALGRRSSAAIVSSPVISCGDVSLDSSSYELSSGGSSVKLGLKEFSIMELLMKNAGTVISKETLITKIWGYESDAEYNNVEVYISFLRKKLSFIKSKATIKTLRGVGYSFSE